MIVQDHIELTLSMTLWWNMESKDYTTFLVAKILHPVTSSYFLKKEPLGAIFDTKEEVVSAIYQFKKR